MHSVYGLRQARSCVGCRQSRKSSSTTRAAPMTIAGISDVECVPVIVADVKIDEVGDAVAQQAVEHISRRAAENQREAALAEPPPARPVTSSQTSSTITATEKTNQQARTMALRNPRAGRRRRRDCWCGPDSAGRGSATWNEPVAMNFSTTYLLTWSAASTASAMNASGYQPLRDADVSDQDLAPPASMPPSRSISASAATQRSQTVGYSAFSPTCVE